MKRSISFDAEILHSEDSVQDDGYNCHSEAPTAVILRRRPKNLDVSGQILHSEDSVQDDGMRGCAQDDGVIGLRSG